jgi:hypothetical protein
MTGASIAQSVEVLGYGLDDRGLPLGRGREFFSSPPRQDRLWGPPSPLYSGYPGGKRPGREADHVPPSSAEVKNAWSYTSIPSLAWDFCYTQGQLHVYHTFMNDV